jgi:putative protein-disulfide isomerase
MHLTYLFDPFCGWCYGAAPALHDLIADGHAVTLAPSGLFVAPGRTMDAKFVAYVRSADQRLAGMTGAVFGEAYFRDVLGHPDPPFDSSPATLALTAVWQVDPSREAAALAAIQRARWVDGRDICDPATLADIVGIPAAAAPDAALREATERRIADAQTLMARLGLNGVPALLRGTEQALPNGLLYGPRAALLAAVA